MLTLPQIRLRDPYIVAFEGMYYMYGTITGETFDQIGGDPNSLYVYRSRDMVNWENPKCIFTLTEDFWGAEDLWAPEVHLYESKFYLFVSFKKKERYTDFGYRGTQICVCDTPDGTFVPLVNRPATPLTQSCIDGTLYVEDGVPYIVYSHDWPDCYDEEKNWYVGEICAMPLTRDLKEAAGEPFLLFTSRDAAWSKAEPTEVKNFRGRDSVRFGSDGPFVNKLSDGSLFLVWSPIPAGNYVVGAAVSKSGKIRGPWEHLDEMVFKDNGGHAMFFDDFDGQKKMCIHCPEKWMEERPLILDVVEKDGKLVVR